MSDTISYNGKKVLVIVNKKLKHSYLSINRDKQIIIKTPYKSKDFSSKLLEEKSAWIDKQFLKIENTKELTSENIYTLEFIQKRVEYFASLMGLQYDTLKFRKMRSRWGSCTSKRVITLNKELLRVHSNLIDYVVVHELAHLVHMNHSKLFHALVQEYLPAQKEYRKELKSIRLS